MKRVMVDIETLGVRADAVVLSIAALSFDFNLSANGTPTFGQGRTWYPSLREQFAAGRTVSPGTLEWWDRDELTQARAGWAHPHLSDPMAVVDEPIAEVYQAFATMVENADEVWAHGVVFDIGILESLFDRVGQPPWKNYGVIRDVRTMVRALPTLRYSGVTSEEPAVVQHNPLDDCTHQVWSLWSVWPKIEVENPFTQELYDNATSHDQPNTTALGH